MSITSSVLWCFCAIRTNDAIAKIRQSLISVTNSQYRPSLIAETCGKKLTYYTYTELFGNKEILRTPIKADPYCFDLGISHSLRKSSCVTRRETQGLPRDRSRSQKMRRRRYFSVTNPHNVWGFTLFTPMGHLEKSVAFYNGAQIAEFLIPYS